MEQLSIDLRPRLYARVVGQEVACTLLQRLRVQSYFPRVILLSGPSGVGKTTLARIWAAHVNCQAEGANESTEPCGVCVQCAAIFAGHSDLVSEIEAATHRKVEDMDAIRSLASFAVPTGSRRVVVIDEFHAISNTGQESLLHVFESVSDTTFVLTTTEPDSILAPILSRCFPINLAPLSQVTRTDVIAQYLNELKVEYDTTVPDLVCMAGRFGMRSAWQSLDKLRIGFGSEKMTDARASQILGIPSGAQLDGFVRALGASYIKAAGESFSLMDAGVEWSLFVEMLFRVCEDMLVMLETGELMTSAGESEELIESRPFTRAQCLRFLDISTDLRRMDWRYGIPRVYAVFAQKDAAAPVESAPAAVAGPKKPSMVELLTSDPVWIRINRKLGTRVVEAYVDA